MEIWKRNLFVCWFGTFVTVIGMSQIAPVLPLYIRQLGIHDTASIEQLSGIAFGATYIIAAVFSPIWGYAADKFGRKPILLMASLGMAVIIFSTGFAQNAFQLIALRLLMGAITGYSTTCTILIAAQTDSEHAGWALGILSTSFLAGSLLGPSVGGYIEDSVSLQAVFFVNGALLMIAFIATLLFVKEQFVRSDEKLPTMKETWKLIPEPGLTITMFVTFFVLQFALYAIEPIVTVYVTQMSPNIEHVALIAGLAFSASGLGSILAAPRLGKLSDEIGSRKVILASLIVGGLLYIPQAFLKSPWQLIALRFLLGLAIAGLAPAINALIKRITPGVFMGRIFGIILSAQYLGIFVGSIIGGQVAAYFGIKYVFFVTSALLLLNALWIYKRADKKLSQAINLKC